MSAADALKAARTAGIKVAVDGNDLVLEAPSQPSAGVLDLLSHHKAGILSLLRPADVGWLAEDWRAFFDERAGIAEHDGGLTRAEAEKQAFEATVVEWVARHLPPSEPERCALCARGRREGAVIVPFGAGRRWPIWLHHQCWAAWRNARRGEAMAGLLTMGLVVQGKPADRSASRKGGQGDG